MVQKNRHFFGIIARNWPQAGKKWFVSPSLTFYSAVNYFDGLSCSTSPSLLGPKRPVMTEGNYCGKPDGGKLNFWPKVSDSNPTKEFYPWKTWHGRFRITSFHFSGPFHCLRGHGWHNSLWSLVLPIAGDYSFLGLKKALLGDAIFSLLLLPVVFV